MSKEDELRRTTERLRRASAGEPLTAIYGTDRDEADHCWEADATVFIGAMLATFHSDDGDAATMDYAEELLHDTDAGVSMRGDELFIDLEDVPIRTKRQLRLIAEVVKEPEPPKGQTDDK